jgi:hypothetical protein
LIESHSAGDAVFREAVRKTAQTLELQLDEAIRAVDWNGLVSWSAVNHPTQEVLDRLSEEERRASQDRERLLQNSERSTDSTEALFRRKRAAKLGKLLRAKIEFQRWHTFENPSGGLPDLLWSDKVWQKPNEVGRAAIRTVLNAH